MKNVSLIKIYNNEGSESKARIIGIHTDKNMMLFHLGLLIDRGDITYQGLSGKEGEDRFFEDIYEKNIDAENNLDNTEILNVCEVTDELKEILSKNGLERLSDILLEENVTQQSDEEDEDLEM